MKIGIGLLLLTLSIITRPNLVAAQIDTAGLKAFVDSQIDNKLVYGIQLTVKKGQSQFTTGSGNISKNQPYFIASTTKLFVTTIILKLREEGKLKLEDPISNYLPSDVMDKLHVLKGQDYSNKITIKNLLAHTSGLPDYFEDHIPGQKKSLIDEILSGNDQTFSFDQTIALSKRMTPLFAPDEPGKAHYSDTNFQLLGRIIEIITGKSFSVVLDEMILTPLRLKDTWMYTDPNDKRPVSLNHKSGPLSIPKAMTSFGPDGGAVSTSTDMLTFLEHFFNGTFFPKTYLPEMYHWNKIMFPLKNGVGVMQFQFPGTPEFIGHSGLSGAFAFYAPTQDIYLTGTVNQIHKPATSYKFMTKVLQFVK